MSKDKKESLKRRKKLCDDKFNILFVTFGGIGESLISANYIYHFKKNNGDNVHIDVVDVHKNEIRNMIFSAITSDDTQVFGMEFEPFFDEYDAIIRIVRYPVILKCNLKKTQMIVPELLKLLETWNSFYDSHREMIDKHPRLDCIGISECIKNGQKRYQQPDIDGFLGIEDLDCPIKHPDTGILDRYGINSDYITINMDTGFNNSKSTKLWSQSYSDEIIELIKEQYPKMIIVLMGAAIPNEKKSPEKCIDLRGETSFEEMMELLEKATLHLSGEGLSVHIRHLLSKRKSIVLFGPTSPIFYGYDENDNISKPCTLGPCEWTTDHWYRECTLTGDGPKCLSDIHPNDVLKKITDYLG